MCVYIRISYIYSFSIANRHHSLDLGAYSFNMFIYSAAPSLCPCCVPTFHSMLHLLAGIDETMNDDKWNSALFNNEANLKLLSGSTKGIIAARVQ